MQPIKKMIGTGRIFAVALLLAAALFSISGCVNFSKVKVGDVVIIMAYTWPPLEEAKAFKPKVIFPDTKTNKL